MAVEERGGADRAHEHATTFIGDLSGEGGAFIALGGDEANLDEFAGVQVLLKLDEKLGREAAFADFDGRFEGLADPAEKSFLRAGEREVIHVSATQSDWWKAGKGKRCAPPLPTLVHRSDSGKGGAKGRNSPN